MNASITSPRTTFGSRASGSPQPPPPPVRTMTSAPPPPRWWLPPLHRSPAAPAPQSGAGAAGAPHPAPAAGAPDASRPRRHRMVARPHGPILGLTRQPQQIVAVGAGLAAPQAVRRTIAPPRLLEVPLALDQV